MTPYPSEGSYTSESREVAVSETWDSWANPQASSNVEVVDGSLQLEEVSLTVPSSLSYQWRAEDFASPWPANVGGVDMTVNGLTQDTFTNGETSVYNGGSEHGEADGPQNLLENETCAVAFTFQWTGDVRPLYFLGARDGNNDFFVRTDSGGPDGNINLKIEDSNGGAISVYTSNGGFNDGTPRTCVINKTGNAASNIDIYVDDMSSPISLSTDTDSGFDHSAYSSSVALGFWDLIVDGSPNGQQPDSHIGVWEFNTEPYSESERNSLVSRRPEVS